MHYRESSFHTSLVLEVWDTFRSALEGLGTYDQVTHMNKAQTLKEKKRCIIINITLRWLRWSLSLRWNKLWLDELNQDGPPARTRLTPVRAQSQGSIYCLKIEIWWTKVPSKSTNFTVLSINRQCFMMIWYMNIRGISSEEAREAVPLQNIRWEKT